MLGGVQAYVRFMCKYELVILAAVSKIATILLATKCVNPTFKTNNLILYVITECSLTTGH